MADTNMEDRILSAKERAAERSRLFKKDSMCKELAMESLRCSEKTTYNPKEVCHREIEAYNQCMKREVGFNHIPSSSFFLAL